VNAQTSERTAGRRPPAAGARQAMTAAIVQLLARRTKYLESEMLGLAELVGPGSVCIDVGAAAGIYTVALSRLVGPEGRVLSVEPLSFAHPLWARILGARSSGNVHQHRVAVGAEAGRGKMSVPVGRHGPVTGRSFLDWNTNGPGSNAEFARQMEVDIDIQTLDGLIESVGLTRLDFIKIDVEGAELHVLEGGQHAIETFRPAMLIEIEDRHAARYQVSGSDVTAWLLARGYTMHTWQGGWQEAASICAHARNYLFLPPEGPAAGEQPPALPAQELATGQALVSGLEGAS
jgi:FkbM family methyltransferase